MPANLVAAATSPGRRTSAARRDGYARNWASPMASTATATSRDGTLIAFEAQGSGLPALVFVHGWSCDRSYWQAQFGQLSTRAQCVVVDLAGHGESDTAVTERDPGAPSIERAPASRSSYGAVRHDKA